MTQPVVKLPDGLYVGQRVKTSDRYAIVNPRAFKGEGTIVAGSNGASGSVWIKLDGHKCKHQMHRNFFEIIA